MKNVASEYQYHLKDHLGNVRLTFTSKIITPQYTATFETNVETTEATNFQNYPSGSHINVVASNAHTGSNSEYLNGAASGQVGVAKSFSVMPGDVVSIQAYAKYLAPTNTPSNILGFAAALLGAFNLPTPAQGEFGTPSSAINSWAGGEVAGFGDGSTDNTDPKVFVTILIFDRNYNFLNVAFQQLTSSGFMSATYKATQPGYAYMYISNEEQNQRDVYFDDVTVSLTPSPVVETTDYYSFGLVAQSFQRQSEVPQNFKYNGKEQINDLGLDWADYGARMYMPEIGRWGVIDPLAPLARRWSPYTYAYDNPIRFIDPDGMYSTEEWMKDNGVTENDVVNIYMAPNENEEPDQQKGKYDPANITKAAQYAVKKVTDEKGAIDSWCNYGVALAFEKITGNKNLWDTYGKLVGKQRDYIVSSGEFKKVDVGDVQDLANSGEVVIGIDKSNGHIVMAVPGEEHQAYGLDVPYVMDTGWKKRTDEKGAEYSWVEGDFKGVTWFKYVGEAEKPKQAFNCEVP